MPSSFKQLVVQLLKCEHTLCHTLPKVFFPTIQGYMGCICIYVPLVLLKMCNLLSSNGTYSNVNCVEQWDEKDLEDKALTYQDCFFKSM